MRPTILESPSSRRWPSAPREPFHRRRHRLPTARPIFELGSHAGESHRSRLQRPTSLRNHAQRDPSTTRTRWRSLASVNQTVLREQGGSFDQNLFRSPTSQDNPPATADSGRSTNPTRLVRASDLAELVPDGRRSKPHPHHQRLRENRFRRWESPIQDSDARSSIHT